MRFSSFYEGSHTFTREDVVEINGHGATVLRMILKEVIRAGPGWRSRGVYPASFFKWAYRS